MKKGIAVISLLLTLQSKILAQSPIRDASSTEAVGRIVSVVEISQLERSADLGSRRSRQIYDRGSIQAQPSTRNHHPVLLGAAIGAGAGLLINATTCRTGESVCSASGNLLMAGIGAGIGALVGVLVSRH